RRFADRDKSQSDLSIHKNLWFLSNSRNLRFRRDSRKSERFSLRSEENLIKQNPCGFCSSSLRSET
ncbi:hypothetical protein, partial [Methanothermococcus sp.]|uniref:hypothetical protein n=1 Tax=Methanothermococcus sp. TaxID=2614238 RepID=UPI00258F6F22